MFQLCVRIMAVCTSSHLLVLGSIDILCQTARQQCSKQLQYSATHAHTADQASSAISRRNSDVNITAIGRKYVLTLILTLWLFVQPLEQIV